MRDRRNPINTRRYLKPRLDADVLTADAIRPTEAEKYAMEPIQF
jgi:hypothetical protein